MVTVKNLIHEKVRLPSPPAIALKILGAVRQDEASFEELAEIIKVDPALTAQMLKIANSAFYGLPNRISSLAQATALLGTHALRNLALSFVIMKSFDEPSQGSFDIDLFWRRAVTSAVAAEILAEKVDLQDQDIFISSLLQDIGVLVMFLSDPASYTEILDNKPSSDASTPEAEQEQFGFDHAEVSYHLLKTWNIPATICEPIRYHHSEEPQEPYVHSARILTLADKISSMFHGAQSNKKLVEIHQGLNTTYGLQDNQTDGIVDAIRDKALEMMDCFSIRPGEMKPMSQILQEANEELVRLNYSYAQMERLLKRQTVELQEKIRERDLEIEERLRAEKALEQKNQELQQFVYIASHDLQEPLRKILAFGDRLHSHSAETLGEKSLDYLARMQNAAARMRQLLEDLLNFSRVTTHGNPFEPVNLEAVIGLVVTGLKQRLAETGGRVFTGPLPVVNADKSQMELVFQHLIANALTFHRENEKPVVKIEGRRTTGMVEISVQDNGIGFDEKYLDRIFKPFQRLHSRDEFDGTGIGLAVCKKIVERHGGTISARSAPGKGATFILCLPG